MKRTIVLLLTISSDPEVLRWRKARRSGRVSSLRNNIAPIQSRNRILRRLPTQSGLTFLKIQSCKT
jgi:hypothetical protein